MAVCGEIFVKRRKLADGNVNIVGAFWVMARIHVGFFR